MSRRPTRTNDGNGPVWTDAGTWVILFVVGSGMLTWGLLSLPLDGAVRGTLVFFAVLAAAVTCGVGWLEAMSNAPLPALDRTPRVARVHQVHEWDHPDTVAEEETKKIIVDYEGADGQTYTAWLGDLVHESSVGRFTPGSRWHVYAFADPELADSTVMLTETHDDVWRSGSLVPGLNGKQFITLRPAAPGSPFLGDEQRFIS